MLQRRKPLLLFPREISASEDKKMRYYREKQKIPDIATICFAEKTYVDRRPDTQNRDGIMCPRMS